MAVTPRALGEIFNGIAYGLLHGASEGLQVESLEFDSRFVKPGSLFFCVVGTQVDGHSFAESAIGHGAVALVVEHELDVDIAQIKVDSAREALAIASANFYGNPSEKLKLVGITGTNGKTTTSFLVEHIVRSCGDRSGLMGTIECHVADEVRPSLHTTPESRDLQKLLAAMVDARVDVAALEVSSHALDLGRVKDTRFEVAAFTNLSQDHLDYHETFVKYFEAKSLLFSSCNPRFSVICVDSDWGKRLAAIAEKNGSDVCRVSTANDPSCDIYVVSARFAAHSIDLEVVAYKERIAFSLPLVGKFNVENAVVALGIGLALGYRASDIAAALSTAPQVPGRLERVMGRRGKGSDFAVLVDYAHTPDSVEKAALAVKAVTPGHVICVFGCGGDRDNTKRPKMGAAALNADFAIVTSDNPRTEDPRKIIEQILPGMAGHENRYEVYLDRQEAIERAIKVAQPGDAVLIAGKGHEDYQIIGTTKYHFDDREIAAEVINQL